MISSEFNVSVIICCYNSFSRIEQTLNHIINQEIKEDLKIEVILVDNNSNDKTVEFANKIWKNSKVTIPFRVVCESKPGLSYARKKGIDSSKANILIFCDDDNWLEKKYIQTAFEIIDKNPKIGMLGGIGQEVIEGNKPAWFDRLKITYAIGPQADFDGDITYVKGFVYGAGSILRKSVLEEIYKKGFINQLSDRIGTRLVSGGDNEIGYMISLSGYKVYYSSELKFKHFLPQKRLSLDYLIKLSIGQQITSYKILCYESYLFNKTFYLPKNRYFKFYKTIKQLIILLVYFFLRKVSYFDFRLKSSKLIFNQYYLLFNYKKIINDIKLVEKNINLIKN